MMAALRDAREALPPGGRVPARANASSWLVSGMLGLMPGQTSAFETPREPRETPPEPREILPEPREPASPYRVCMVCLGNICRSPTAELVLRAELTAAGMEEQVRVESTGTGDWHVGESMFRPARLELDRRGYDGSRHRARQIQPEWLTGYDLVLAMDQANLADLRRMSPDAESTSRIRLLRSFDPALAADDPYDGEVPDPFGGGPEQYELTFELVKAATSGLLAALAASLGEPAAEAQ